MPEAEWASPETASSDEAQIWQVVSLHLLFGHLLPKTSSTQTQIRTSCQDLVSFPVLCNRRLSSLPPPSADPLITEQCMLPSAG